jgi:hypothetical protein
MSLECLFRVILLFTGFCSRATLRLTRRGPRRCDRQARVCKGAVRAQVMGYSRFPTRGSLLLFSLQLPHFG